MYISSHLRTMTGSIRRGNEAIDIMSNNIVLDQTMIQDYIRYKNKLFTRLTNKLGLKSGTNNKS